MMESEISFNPNGYTGRYNIWSRSQEPLKFGPFFGSAGPVQCRLPPGGYNLWISPGANFRFEVTNEGDAWVEKEGCGLEAAGRTIRMKVTDISIYVGSYPGTLAVAGVSDSLRPGSRCHSVLVGQGTTIHANIRMSDTS